MQTYTTNNNIEYTSALNITTLCNEAILELTGFYKVV